jgi:hypothetical protein
MLFDELLAGSPAGAFYAPDARLVYLKVRGYDQGRGRVTSGVAG